MTFATSISLAQVDEYQSSLSLQPGQEHRISYVLTREVADKGTTVNVSASILIKAVQPESFFAEWTTESTSYASQAGGKSLALAVEELVGFPIEYWADKTGSPKTLSNKESLIERLVAGSSAFGSNSEAGKNVESILGSMSDRSFARMFLKLPTLLAICSESNLRLGEPVQYSTELANPIGDGTIDGFVYYELKRLDRASNTAEIEYWSTYDPRSTQQLIDALLTQAKSNGELSKDEPVSKWIDRIDRASCIINTQTGWVRTMTYSTDIRLLDNRISESYVISVD